MRFLFASYIFFIFVFLPQQMIASSEESDISFTIQKFKDDIIQQEEDFIKEELKNTSIKKLKVKLTLHLKNPNSRHLKKLKKKDENPYSEEDSWLLLAHIYNRNTQSFQSLLESGHADPNVELRVHAEVEFKDDSQYRFIKKSQPRNPLYYASSISDGTQSQFFVEALVNAGSMFVYSSEIGRLITDKTLAFFHLEVLKIFTKKNLLPGEYLSRVLNKNILEYKNKFDGISSSEMIQKERLTNRLEKLNGLLDAQRKLQHEFKKSGKPIQWYKDLEENFREISRKIKQKKEEIKEIQDYLRICWDELIPLSENYCQKIQDYLQAGAEIRVNIRGMKLNAPAQSLVHNAIHCRNIDMVNTLLSHDSSMLDLRNENQENPFDLAILQFELLDHNSGGNTALLDPLFTHLEYFYVDQENSDHPLSTSFISASFLKNNDHFFFMVDYLIKKFEFLLSDESFLSETNRDLLQKRWNLLRNKKESSEDIVLLQKKNIFEVLIRHPYLNDEDRNVRILHLVQRGFQIPEELLRTLVFTSHPLVIPLINAGTQIPSIYHFAARNQNFQHFQTMTRYLLNQENLIDEVALDPINHVDPREGTVLHYLINTHHFNQLEREQRIEFLLNRGERRIDPNTEFNGQTPLAFAIRSRQGWIVRQLMMGGANVFHESVEEALSEEGISPAIRRSIETQQRHILRMMNEDLDRVFRDSTRREGLRSLITDAEEIERSSGLLSIPMLYALLHINGINIHDDGCN